MYSADTKYRYENIRVRTLASKHSPTLTIKSSSSNFTGSESPAILLYTEDITNYKFTIMYQNHQNQVKKGYQREYRNSKRNGSSSHILWKSDAGHSLMNATYTCFVKIVL